MFKSSQNTYFSMVLLFLASFVSFAQVSTTPSASQIEQFKKLPKSQQQALAKQYGVDINSFLNQTPNSTSNVNSTEKPEQQYLTTENNTEFLSKLTSDDEQELKLKPFGYDLFKQNQSSFLPEGQLPVPADYILAPGDSIQVNLYGKESSQYTLTINNSGQITIPNLEPLTVSGLSYQEVKTFISQTVKTKMIGIKATTSIANLGGIQVYVIGDVTNPGAYYLSSLSTVTNALFISGGPSEIGSLRNIEIKRGGKVVAKTDLYELFINGDATNDVRLQQGDVIFVPAISQQVSITGEVRRPAIYEIKSNETIADAIKIAGGLNLNAYPKNVLVASFNDSYQRDIKRINLDELSNNDKVKNGDVITVLPVSGRLDKVVNVAGAVSRPSTYAWHSGMSLSDLISSKDDLLTSTDLEYALVLTQTKDGSFNIQQFKPTTALNGEVINLFEGALVVFFNRYEENTFEITPEDISDKPTKVKPEINYLQVIQNGTVLEKQEALLRTKSYGRAELLEPIMKILSATNLKGELVSLTTVTGQVKFPGIYPLANNSTVNHAIDAAGGLTESANLQVGEISRTTYDNEGEVLLEHIRFNLDWGVNNNIVLKPKDVVNVFQKDNWQESYNVTLKGEVKYPGTYSVSAGETLLQVLERAGGLTKFANPSAAFYTREVLKELEQKQAKSMAKALSKELAFKSISATASNINVSEVQMLVKQLTDIEGVGRLIIDLPELLLNKTNDIALEDGDALYIPSFRNEVNIVGEVQVATTHLYKKDWDIDNYIISSGGLTIQSDEKRTYIIRENGLVESTQQGSWFSSIEIKPGDTIVVPLDTEYTDRLTLWEKSTSIFYQLSVGLAAIASF